ncbi:MAG TPA: hypothetical protein GX403_18595 [Rhodocyclaceae bacterium]|nr:hypothetical protein [Rhodocyclaceae bacterium]
MNTQAPAGDDIIRITATRQGGNVTQVKVQIPALAWMGTQVVGMTPATATTHLRAHSSHSPRAHACAVEQACARALGEPPPDEDAQIAMERILAAEMADTHLRRLLIDWPPEFGFEPRLNRFAEFHRQLIAPSEPEAAFALGGEVLDLVAREMLAGFFNQIRMPHGIGEFIDRLNAGGSLSSVMNGLIAMGASAPPAGGPSQLLGTLSAAAWVNSVGHWPTPEFIRYPTYGGAPAETGPLARHAPSPLVRLLLERGHRVSARLFAKAIDVADCASRMRHPNTDDVPPLIDAVQVEPAVGMARVATARGALLCWVRIADGVISDCAMVPAGAWNFHPDGPFCREAVSGPAGGEDLEGARKRLSVLALALDPSIAHTVDITERTAARKRA